MYESFYGLTKKPFSITPDPSFLYWSAAHRFAYSMLQYGLTNGSPITVITGSIGCGKTTLLNNLLKSNLSSFTVGTLSTLHGTIDSLTMWVLKAFDQPNSETNEVALMGRLEQFLVSQANMNKRCVLIIDEAQNLSVAALEQLRVISNYTRNHQPLLQLILVGQPQLKDLLSRPDMVQFVQRVSADFHLKPFTPEEVKTYISRRLEVAGCTKLLFTKSAINLIAETTGGVPRLINVLCDASLIYGYSMSENIVSEKLVAQVISDKREYGVFEMSPDLSKDPKDMRHDVQDQQDKPALVINDPELAKALLSQMQKNTK